MFLLALLTPVIIIGWGFWWGDTLQTSLSAYYFGFQPKVDTNWAYSNYPTRVFFVGILFALGFSLWAYKGFSRLENILLNIAGLCAILVAIFPMWPGDWLHRLLEDCALHERCRIVWVHGRRRDLVQ